MTQEHDAETVERVAAAMWRAETVDAGTPESVTLRRTPEAFASADDKTRATWSKFARAAIAAMPPRDVPQWEPIETAPDMERIWVCGWQPKIGRVMGYWWYHEDVCDGGVSIEHPNARYWSPIVIPMFPPANWANLPPAPEAK